MEKTIKHPTPGEKESISLFFKDMQFLIGIQNYDNKTMYVTNDAKDGEVTGQASLAAASITIDEDYQRISVTIYPSFWNSNNRDDQRKYILHELSHYLTDPQTTIADDLHEGRFHSKSELHTATEKSTSQITNILELFLNSDNKKYVERFLKAYDRYMKVEIIKNKPKKQHEIRSNKTHRNISRKK